MLVVVALLAALLAALAAAAVLVATRAEDPSPGRTSGDASARPVAAPRTAAPLRGEVLGTLGVVSYNALRHLRLEKARSDWDRITGDPRIDLIGWQESKSSAFRELYPQYVDDGWQTWHYPTAAGPLALAVSWRTSELELVDVAWRQMHRGRSRREVDTPFPARWVVTARFVHRASGRTVTLLNTHVNQAIETGDRFRRNLNARFAKVHLATMARMWDDAPGDVVVGTGDYNFDHVDDARARPRGGLTRAFAGHATSSWEALGLRGTIPTRYTRYIDYVFLADDTVRDADDRAGEGGAAQFAWHRVLRGYRSDHHPVLARLRIYDGA